MLYQQYSKQDTCDIGMNYFDILIIFETILLVNYLYQVINVTYLNLSGKLGFIKFASMSCLTHIICVMPDCNKDGSCDLIAALYGPRYNPGITS